MLDFAAPSSTRALAELRKQDTYAHLMKFAAWRCGSTAAAEDLLSDATFEICDPARRPWDPARGSFESHMRTVVRDLARARIRAGAGRFERAHDGAGLDQEWPHPAPDAEAELRFKRDREWMREMAERTLARVQDGYPFARPLFELVSSGHDKPAELAQKLGCPVEQVYATMDALKRHAPQVRAEWERSELERMRSRRQGANRQEAAR
ncbi:MAG TPA: hypothetical protein VKU41_25420 [Polyangiaceae bacterium]|nr:hypothetical protein [Polyangiaceae bacterium]